METTTTTTIKKRSSYKTYEIKKIVEDFGHLFLNEYLKDNYRMVVFQDKDGYKYDMSLHSLMRKDLGIRYVDKSNPHALENISLWLKKNKIKFSLNNENKYDGAHMNLFLHCFVCDDDFYMSWNLIHRKTNCALCTGKQIGKYNNLEYLRPDLAREWVESKNKLNPKICGKGSQERVLWKCFKCQHQWWTRISERTKKNGTNCPACAGQVLSDLNRLSIRFPNIALEWHPTLNEKLTPADVSYGTRKKVWWICKNGHEWQAAIANRCGGNRCCPKCKRKSKGEKIIAEFLENNSINFIQQYTFDDCKYKQKLPFDFYLLDYNILIEYDGEFHSEVGRFPNKEKAIQQLKILKEMIKSRHNIL